MNSQDIEKVKVLGNMIFNKVDNVDSLIKDNRLNMSIEAIDFSKELISFLKQSPRGKSITPENIDAIYQEKFRYKDNNQEYKIISEVIKSYFR